MIMSMFLFALVMSITPGPVNMIILSSGINYGVKKTFPYVSGATIGFILLLLCTGFVFETLLIDYPFLFTYLSLIGATYTAFIGYKIATSIPTIEMNKNNAPQFYEGFLLQWLNPKAWIACISGVALFSSIDSYTPFLLFTSIYFFVCYISLGLWSVLGNKVSYFLNSHLRMRLFNLLMGSLLIAIAVYSVWRTMVE